MDMSDRRIIPEIPEMRDEILEAIDNNTLIIFVGAGLSKLYGYPLWSEMANSLIQTCRKRGCITRSQEKVLLSKDFSSMQLVTIAFEKIAKEISVDEAQRIVAEELSDEKSQGREDDINRMAKYLSNYHCTIATTNADLSLDHSTSFEYANIVENFIEWDGDTSYNKLLHIHGSINNFEQMVFTSKQYAKAYMSTSAFGMKLQSLLNPDITVLFIGYGVNEFELIRYFLNAKNESRKNFFMLKGYLDCDIIQKDFDKEYYESIGIELLPYSMEKSGYHALVSVLEKWDESVTTKTMAHLHVRDDVNRAFSEKPTNESLNFIKGLL